MFKTQAIAADADLFRYFYNKVRGKRGNGTKARAMGREAGIEEGRGQCVCQSSQKVTRIIRMVHVRIVTNVAEGGGCVLGVTVNLLHK